MADLYKILEAFDRIGESNLTPVGVKKGLNPQQKSVKQMPALFKMKSQGPVLGGDIKDAPSKGYFVGGEAAEDGKVIPMTQGGYTSLKDKNDYLDKRDLLYRTLSQPGVDHETREAIKAKLKQLELTARNAGLVQEQGEAPHGVSAGTKMFVSELGDLGDAEGYGVSDGDAGADATPDGVSPDTKSFLEGQEEDNNPMRQAVTRRITNQHPEWITRYGVEALIQAINDVTEGEEDWEEIGSSDVSAYVNYVKDRLDDRMGGREEMDDRKPFAEAKASATEDVLSTVKKKLGDYLQDIAAQIKTDPDLKDKIPQDIEKISPAVKTIRTDDGHEIKIHGNEDDGFRISIKNKQANTKFSDLDEAVMACEMYCNRRRAQQAAHLNDDYLEER